jgi:hypothetical protein
MVNDTTLLLGLDGLAVTKVVAAGDGARDEPVVHLATADERARLCPQCGVAAVQMKEWVTTRPRDLPSAGGAVRCVGVSGAGVVTRRLARVRRSPSRCRRSPRNRG